MSLSSSTSLVRLGDIEPLVERRLATLRGDSIIQRIWKRDPTVWGGKADTPELANRLGWLDVADRTLHAMPEIERIAEDVRERFDRVVLCGMGGSSLAPEVLNSLCRGSDAFPSFTMLDSTCPAAVRAAEGARLERTLFLVSSKSGSTLETTSFYRYFWKRTNGNGAQFAAITDPGSSLERLANENDFRAVVAGEPEVGGRFSALSSFGILPAVLFGANARGVLQSAQRAMSISRETTIDASHPGWFGAMLGECAGAGRDKLTIHVPPALRALGLWLEQLVAESTGKQGKGILPVVIDEVPEPSMSADDRIFVSIAFRGDGTAAKGLEALAAAGHPAVSFEISSSEDIGAEFFRWEFATAVAGYVLGVNPFDQPDVSASKANTGRVLDEGTPLPPSVDPGKLESLVHDIPRGHYLALLAYVEPTEPHERRLRALARRLERQTGVAVTTGVGPRYLHSTGQLHKGGPRTGHFLQVVEAGSNDVEIPGMTYGFRRLLEAQAIGDYQALQHIGRPIALIHGLDRLEELLSWS